jgi:enoyl-CoA hydratase/carnithine racemase
MNPSATQFRVANVTESYWRVTFDNPPINLVTPDTINELQRFVESMEDDTQLKVVVFDSTNPDFFLARYDLSRAAELPVTPGPTGLPTWIDLTSRLAHSRVVSIASVRGRTRGAGSEFCLACDMRFASSENALFGQPEVPAGIVPGGGALERLPLLCGRARALEIVLGGNDFDALSAEHYGWINRAVPDAELDAYVDTLARRIAAFDAEALREAKRMINRHSLPAAADMVEAQGAMIAALARPAARERGAKARKLAATDPRDFELRLGHHLGNIPA